MMILMAFKFLFDQVIQTKHINIIPASIPDNYPYIYKYRRKSND